MAKAIEFRVENATYKTMRPMDFWTQLEMSAKVLPLIAAGFGELTAIIMEMKAQGLNDWGSIPRQRAAMLAVPVAKELSRMSADDRRYIISECLLLCERKMDGQEFWAPIWNVAAARSQFADINEDISIIARITLGVIHGTFNRFFPASLSELIGGAFDSTMK